MPPYDDDTTPRVHLDIKPDDRPFKRVQVDVSTKKYISKIHKDHPEWGAARIIAHAKHNRGPTLTYDQVLSVLIPEKK